MTDIQLSPLDEAMNVIIDNRRLQLSPAACDPVKAKHRTPFDNWLSLISWTGPRFDPEDFGIETFSTDTLEGGMPDD